MLGAIVALAVWQVGPRPKSADAGFPATPPPLALPTATPAHAPLAGAAALLAAGHLDAARRAFVDVVAEDQGGIPGQVGLILSRWTSTGPISVERDLQQLAVENPDSAFVALHLGMVQTLVKDTQAARATLRSAIELGHAAGDGDSLRMATLAEDLLHPGSFGGPMPILVRPGEVAAGTRPLFERLLAANTRGDAAATARLAPQLLHASDAMARIAAIVATFDKDAPDVVVDRLGRVAVDRSEPQPARDRARMLASLAYLWGGSSRDVGCTRLAVSVGAGIDPATRRLAVPIHTELCAKA
jgi:hypothetical protein